MDLNHIAQSQFYYWQMKVTQVQQNTEGDIETRSGYLISAMKLLPSIIKVLS
ncbi:hypothetical protein [Photobacterium sp.]|uniref:hypothetical protein n=1 Tax=Photobacterium sp. TaxID=660 RepID=UPI00299CF541|nr:hypothetical protein [Photobacterium sp.]MDX1303666.1 hypothetical protein [Photobacterium sp.]